MKKPTRPKKPKKPNIPNKPSEIIQNFVDYGSQKFYDRPSLRDFLNEIFSQLGMPSEKINFDKIFITGEIWGLEMETDCPNPSYEEEMKDYEKKLEKFPNEMEEYERKMKIYDMKLPIWKAWHLSQKQQEHEKTMRDLEIKIRKIEQEKKKLLKNISDREIIKHDNVENNS